MTNFILMKLFWFFGEDGLRFFFSFSFVSKAIVFMKEKKSSQPFDSYSQLGFDLDDHMNIQREK